MSESYETKRAILGLISTKPKTLTDISRELDLAPSTISQHLMELRNSGVIEQVVNPYVKKWKYYTMSNVTTSLPPVISAF